MNRMSTEEKPENELKPSDLIQDEVNFGALSTKETINLISHYISNVVMKFFQSNEGMYSYEQGLENP